MKVRHYILTAICLIFLGINAEAKIWRVNNNPGGSADFTAISDAVNAATAGDTIHVEPSPTSYQGIDLSKRLVIIGNGFFLDQNIGLKANTGTSTIQSGWNFNSGSEGSIVTGLRIQHNSPIKVNADSVFIIRNDLYAPLTINANNVFVLQNFSPYGYNFILSASASNCYIFNNIFYRIDASNSSSHQVINNIFLSSGTTLLNSIVQNNIFGANNITGNNTFTNCIVQNNLGRSAIPAGDGNQSHVIMTTVFVGPGTSDGQWQLAPGSPAIGAGYYGGEDCGAFDVPPGFGWVPYRLSGIPSVPSIYEFSTTLVGDSLQVNLSTRANN